MGLIKKAIYLGAGYAAFKTISKEYHKNQQQEHDYRLQQQQMQSSPQSLQFRQPSPLRSRDGSIDECYASGAGYNHQHYCNGSCGNACHPSANGFSTRAVEAEDLPVYTGQTIVEDAKAQ